jgi:hypothetical protein
MSEPAAEDFQERFGDRPRTKREAIVGESPKAEMLQDAIRRSHERCPGGAGCQCCNVSGGCDCGCRNDCPKFRAMIVGQLKNIPSETVRQLQPPTRTTEPLYTMTEAIDQIIDGLRLEWVDYDGEFIRVEDNQFGWFTVRRAKEISADGVSISYRWDFCAFEGRDTPERPRRLRGTCDSFETGKIACLDVYKSRVRAVIEGAVKHGEL